MQDELDAKLMQRFAAAEEPLTGEPFVGALGARLRRHRSFPGGLYSVLGTLLGGLAGGILVPLRLRQTRFMVLGAAAVTLLSVFG
ncbi:MAG TPA: hypothetical protein VH109_08070 [Steroidobacteraceae bacterium]|jgi:hypothetical protein|nr:hypothetical protein [Steroidobacteraceae bacterium]